MEWHDQGFVVHARKHGESSAIVAVLTQQHGRCAGLVRGGNAKRSRALLQPGHQVAARWRARLNEHLGTMTLEPVKLRSYRIYDDADRLAGLMAAAAMVEAALPEREPHAAVYHGFAALVEALETADYWPLVYVRFEMGLLTELGFGLDLSACAATGSRDALIYVSPRSGRAVSAEAGRPYHAKMLRLPPFLADSDRAIDAGRQDVLDGLALTGFFLHRALLEGKEAALPPARARLTDRLAGRRNPKQE